MPKQIEILNGNFDKSRVREINNKITKMFNDFTKKHELKTILVVVQTKDGKQKQNWCTVGRTSPEKIAFIGLYEYEQIITCLN